MINKSDYLSLVVILMLCVCSLAGIFSLDFTNSFDITNQYGDTVTIFGSGIYSGDTYFKAPIFIGTDFCILFVVVPLFIIAYIKKKKHNSNSDKLNLMALHAVAFYYAMSMAFGAKYNQLHLVYIILFASSLFGMFQTKREIELEKIHTPLTKGLKLFLIVTEIVLIVAWLPDITIALINGKPIPLIGVYTTEITYVLDMGLVAPLCFICISMLKKQEGLGVIILAAILKLCLIVGIMIIPQSICQYLSGIEVPLVSLITKAASFVVLGGFAFYFEQKLYKKL
jgi:hypothetical protein